MESKMGNIMKNIVLAGIGAVAVTSEKAKDVVDELVKKGELTVEQGKVLNEELKHNIKETLRKQTKKDASVEELLYSMTPDQIAALKELLSRKQAEAEEAKSETGAEEAAEAGSKAEPEEMEGKKAEETSKVAESSEASASADE